MADELTIYRNDPAGNVLRLASTPTGYSLTTTGGGNITTGEYDQIAGFVPADDRLLVKLRARMER